MTNRTSFADVLNSFIDQFADAIAERLSGSRGSSAPAPSAAPAPAAASSKAAAQPAGRRRKGQKRTADSIAESTSELLQYVKANEGKRIEEIAKALRISTKDLKLPATKLLAARKVKTKGEKRGTRYYAA